MKKRLVTLLLASALAASLLTGCGAKESPAPAVVPETTEAAAPETEAPETEAAADPQAAADACAALIDAIYVQEWTEDTASLCAQAKAAWDALPEEAKALVEGEEASPDYFGLDTGDASADDPGNADGIGEKEILVVSFGTSYNDSRVQDICGLEKTIAEAYPEWSVRRAFTAQIIINHILARDGYAMDNMTQALERAVANGVKELVVQPTHLMHGAEYDEMMEALAEYEGKFDSVKVAEPLLGPVGEDPTVLNADKEAAARAVVEAALADAGYTSAQEAAADGTAIVTLGHGTSHTAKITYMQMAAQMAALGYENVFVGTVEGEPEETECQAVIDAVAAAGYKKIILRPLMVVAGDHANNDMAGEDEDSWKSTFLASGKFESVDCQIAGMGSIPAVREIYLAHIQEAMAQ